MSRERVRTALETFVARLLARLPFHAKWPGRVVSQGTDGSLEVLLDTDVVPGEVGAKMRTAVPGMVIRVPAGTRVQVAYEGGDPRAPVAELFESGNATEIAISVGGQAALEHVTTAEAVAGMLVALGALVTPPLTPAQVAGALATAASAPLDPLARGAITAWLAAAAPKTSAASPPGLGCKAFLSG